MFVSRKSFPLPVVLLAVLMGMASVVFAEEKATSAATPATKKIPEFVLGPPSFENGRAFRELADHPEQWEKVREKMGALLYADHRIQEQFPDDAELTAIFRKYREIGVTLQMNVGAVKPWGKTGKECFDKQKPKWERFLRCGAVIDGIAIDEPYTCCKAHIEKDFDDAVEETAEFIGMVRKDYPDWVIGVIECYPYFSAEELIRWVDVLEDRLKQKGTRGLDFFCVDTNWMHFVHDTGKGNWRGLKQVENHCRAKKLPFSVIYWSAAYPFLESKREVDDAAWYAGVMQMAYDYATVDGRPDQIVVQSWVNGPKKIIPESESYTFTRSALDVAERFVIEEPKK